MKKVIEILKLKKLKGTKSYFYWKAFNQNIDTSIFTDFDLFEKRVKLFCHILNDKYGMISEYYFYKTFCYVKVISPKGNMRLNPIILRETDNPIFGKTDESKYYKTIHKMAWKK